MSSVLTDTYIRNLKSVGRYTDAATLGLNLQVKASGGKYWTFRYLYQSKRHDLGLGTYPAISLREARARATNARNALNQGKRPVATWKPKPAVSKETKSDKPTFKEFAKNCIDSKKAEWRNDKHGAQWYATIKQYADPVIGNKNLDEIDTDDILKILNPIWHTKTVTASRLRGRIEWVLAAANLRSAPKNVEDVWIGASNCHIVSYENLSFLSQNYQDALCVLATGGAHATRTLYTNKEEVIIELRKPIVLNGISVNVTAQDLLDRSLHIELPRVEKRLLSNDVEQSFMSLQPSLLGALLNQFCYALNVIPNVTIPDEDKPRMLDFAYLGEAVFQANGLAEGSFLRQYKNMRQKGVYRTLEAFPIGVALANFLHNNSHGWSGKLIELLGILNQYKPHGENAWPKSGKAMGDAVRRLAPSLRTLGFDCHSDPKVSGSIIWHIKPICAKESNQSTTSTASPKSEGEASGLEGHERLEFNYKEDFGNEETLLS